MIAQHPLPCAGGKGVTLVRMGQKILNARVKFFQRAKGCQFILRKQLGHERPPVHKLKGPHACQFKRARIDKIALAHKLRSAKARVQIQVDARGIVDFDALIRINARAAALHVGRKQALTVPVRPPDFKITPHKLTKSQPTVGVTRAKKADIGPIFALFLLGQLQWLVEIRLGRQRQIQGIALPDAREHG